jgi:hypothetical protein
VELKRSLRHNLTHVLGQLSGTQHPELEAPREIGRTRASQDVPLPEILRAYRLGFTFMWERLLHAAQRSGPQAMDGLLAAATVIWELADEYSVALTESYREHMSERLVMADRRRSGLVAALLGGPLSIERSPWEVAKLLGMPFQGNFLVLVADVSEDGAALVPSLESRLKRVDVTSAWRAQPDTEIGVLSLGRRRAASDIVALLADLPTTRVGVSPSYGRLDETARAARFAQVAVDTMPAGSRGVRQLDDVPLTDLLVQDRDTTRRFVLRVLGNVLRLPDDDRSTLLATAEAWVAARGSATEAGRVLYCHENTVRHRIHRLEEHLAVAFDDPRNLSDLTTALQAIRTFPELGQRLVANNTT